MHRRLTAGLLLAAVLLASCSGPSATPARKFKVGLVTDVGQLAGNAFNASALKGLKKAELDLGITVSVLESAQASDYPRNIESLITQGGELLVTVGARMAEDTLSVARLHPNLKFAIVDYEYPSNKNIENGAEPYSTYARNITSLVFREDQAGYLVGAVAGAMTRSNVVGGVYGPASPPVCRFRDGYEHGAKWANVNVRTLGVYQPSSGPRTSNDPDWGRARGLEQIGQGADVLFGAGGQIGNGALLAARDKTTPARPTYAIGADQDQYDSSPEARPALLTSAVKNVDVAVFAAIKALAEGRFKAGPMTFDVNNDGVAAAPFHDLEGKVTQVARDKLALARRALVDKTAVTGYNPNNCK